jgi:hypothetical protein
MRQLFFLSAFLDGANVLASKCLLVCFFSDDSATELKYPVALASKTPT